MPPLAGFFSKDEILWQAWSTAIYAGTGLGMWYGKVHLAGRRPAAACTAFYMTRLVIKTFLDRPKWATATAFSGAGLPDDDEPSPLGDDESMLDMGAIRKKPSDPAKRPAPLPGPMKGDEAVGGDLPEDESLLDFGKVGKKGAAPPPPPAHDSHQDHQASQGHDEPDHGHAHDLPQDESMLDMGRVTGQAGGARSHEHDAHDSHGAPAAHDSGHGHGHDDDAGHGGGHGHPASRTSRRPRCSWRWWFSPRARCWSASSACRPALGGSNLFEHWLAPVRKRRNPTRRPMPTMPGKSEHGEAPKAHGHDPMEYVLMAVSVRPRWAASAPRGTSTRSAAAFRRRTSWPSTRSSTSWCATSTAWTSCTRRR